MKEAANFLEHLLCVCWTHPDASSILSYFEEDFTYQCSFLMQDTSGFEKKQIIEFAKFLVSLPVHGFSSPPCFHVKPMGDGLCLVTGSCLVCMLNCEKTTLSICAVCRHRQDGDWGVSHLFLSDEQRMENKLCTSTLSHYHIVCRENKRLAQQNSHLSALAQTDCLTQILNRRTICQLIDTTIVQARQGAAGAFCILFVDVNDFKQLNDTYGHRVGDQILTTIASLCSRALRKGDFIGRYGGDEFLIFLKDATLQQAQTIARRLEQSVANHDFCCCPGVAVTLSIGHACYREGATVASLIEEADKKMYLQKTAKK